MDYHFGLLHEAIFVKRDNRFRAEIELSGQALSLGVEAYAYKCSVTKEGINFAGEIPIILKG